jgi:hypothetical protein
MAALIADVLWTGGSSRGIPASQSRALPLFQSVELAGSNLVAIHVGGKQSVVVHAESKLLDRVTTEVRSGRLVIANKPGSYTSKTPMSVEISMPSLTGLRLSGSGIISANGVDVPRIVVTLPGSGMISASGKATQLDVTVGGSGNAQLAALTARDVHAILGGSGTIFTHATSSLQASIPGSGTILYVGNPQHLTTRVTGSGVILPSGA